MPTAAASARVRDHRLDACAGVAAPVPQQQQDEKSGDQRQQDQPVGRIGNPEEFNGAGKYLVDALVIAAENRFHHLAHEDRQAPRRQQRVERPAVEVAHDRPLDQHSDDRAYGKCQRESRQKGQAGRLHHVDTVGAQHDEFAMRHVHDAEQAENHRKPQRDQRQGCDGIYEIHAVCEDQIQCLRTVPLLAVLARPDCRECLDYLEDGTVGLGQIDVFRHMPFAHGRTSPRPVIAGAVRCALEGVHVRVRRPWRPAPAAASCPRSRTRPAHSVPPASAPNLP